MTIVYPDGVPVFWDFLQGKCRRVVMEVTPHQIPAEIYAAEDADRRAVLAQWIRELWEDKDQRITSILST